MRFHWLYVIPAALLAIGMPGCDGGGGGGAEQDAAPDGGDTDTADTDTGFPTGPCDDDYPRNPFDDSADTVAYDQPLPAFALTTLDGELAFPDSVLKDALPGQVFFAPGGRRTEEELVESAGFTAGTRPATWPLCWPVNAR